MIKNFDEIKTQLTELAGVINAFKSEAVQLRIVELVLQADGRDEDVGGSHDDPTGVAAESVPKPTGRRRRRPKPAEGGAGESPAPARRRANGVGPVSTLDVLIAEGFFKKRQTIGKIVEHARSNKARVLKPSDISGPLGRLVRVGKLKREKNADGQFEYFT